MFSTISEYIFGKSSEGLSEDSVEEAQPKDLQISQFQQLSASVTSVTSETLAEEWEVVSIHEVEDEVKSTINADDPNNSMEIEEAEDAVTAQELARENYLIENPCSDITNSFGRSREDKANDPKSKSQRRLVKLNSKPKKDNKNAQLRLLGQQKLLQLSHRGSDGSGCISLKPLIHHKNQDGHGHGGKRGKCRNDNMHYTRKSNVNNDRKCGKMQW